MTVTIDSVRDFLGAQPGSAPLVNEVLQNALDAAEEQIIKRCVPLGDPRPDVVDQAIIMQAARLYRRRYSVSGYEGFGDLGIARVATVDSDIDDLLALWLKYSFA